MFFWIMFVLLFCFHSLDIQQPPENALYFGPPKKHAQNTELPQIPYMTGCLRISQLEVGKNGIVQSKICRFAPRFAENINKMFRDSTY